VRILQVITIVLIGINLVTASMLFRTAQMPGQDAAGRGMAQAFAGVTITAVIVAALLLALSYYLQSTWPTAIAAIVVVLPLVITVLPVLL
jgi:hypothetical protein